MIYQPLVSIIMPVYNAGQYFKPCIESILNQTLKDIELILVLDKPTDGTDRLAYEYAKLDNRIIILQNEENLHIGLSRNQGLAIAKGKYIAFSDHDDLRELTMYQTLYKIAQKNELDILLSCPTMKYGDDIEKWEYLGNKYYLKSFLMSDLVGFGNCYRGCPSFCFLHFNLYRRDLIVDNKIEFVDTRYITPEDVIFNLECIYCAKNIDYINTSLYYHEEYQGSTGRKLSYNGCKARLAGMNYIYNFLVDKDILELYRPNFNIYVRKETLNSIVRSNYWNRDYSGLFRNIRLFKEYPFIKDVFKDYIYGGYPPIFYKNIFRYFVAFYLAH